MSTPIPACQAMASAPPSGSPDPLPTSPLETPLLLAHSSWRSPPPPILLLLSCSRALGQAPPVLSPIGSLAPASSAPSCPSPSEGCNIRFTIWGLSCYNNRRRLCCEEQLARSLCRPPPALPPSLQPSAPAWPLPSVCVYGDACPGLPCPGSVTGDCHFAVAGVNLVYELSHRVCACVQTHTLSLLHFPSTVCPH